MRDKLNIVVSYLTKILIKTIMKALIKIKLWKLISKDILKAFKLKMFSQVKNNY